MKKRVIYILICLGILIVSIPFLCSTFLKSDPQGMIIDKVSVNQEQILISGTNYGGLLNYKGYKTRFEDGILYIKYDVGLKFPWNKNTNATDYYPIKNEYTNLSEIYITNDLHRKERLVWTKGDGEILS